MSRWFLVAFLITSPLCYGEYTRWLDLFPSVPYKQREAHNIFDLAAVELQNVKDLWKLFKAFLGKEYSSTNEELKRLLIFTQNILAIKENLKQSIAGNSTYKMGVNKFSDRTLSELKFLKGFKPSRDVHQMTSSYIESGIKPIPDQVDWRKMGAVTPVKDQGSCGSCWAFSSTGSLEGQNFRKIKKLISLSEQQLVDCSSKYGNSGCEGGLMNNAFLYLKEKNGSDTESSYPYVSGKNGKANKFCQYNRSNVAAHVTGIVNIPNGDERLLKNALASVGPISIAINADLPSFMQYSSGVYSDPACANKLDDLNHGVLLVGYGKENGISYWLVKNSWGTDWGDAGYIKIVRNGSNMCGVATAASYPLV